MSKEKLLLIGGDASLVEPVSRLLKDRDVALEVVDPRCDDVRPDAVFDAAFDCHATAVVLIESLPRHGGQPVSAPDELLTAALRAARAPMVTGFGWVTTREDTAALAELKKRGKPFGVLRPAPLIELEVSDTVSLSTTKSVLLNHDIASHASEVGALPIEDAAEAVATWIVEERMRGGAHQTVKGPIDPMQRAIRELGIEPTVLASWRVGLNGVLGMPVLDQDGELWRIHRRSWFRKAEITSARRAGERLRAW
jgi:hypothetical protein